MTIVIPENLPHHHIEIRLIHLLIAHVKQRVAQTTDEVGTAGAQSLVVGKLPHNVPTRQHLRLERPKGIRIHLWSNRRPWNSHCNASSRRSRVDTQRDAPKVRSLGRASVDSLSRLAHCISNKLHEERSRGTASRQQSAVPQSMNQRNTPVKADHTVESAHRANVIPRCHIIPLEESPNNKQIPPEILSLLIQPGIISSPS